MYEISTRMLAPYSSICYIQCQWADGTVTRASGIVVGMNDVLTAHHAVYDAAHGGYATSIMVAPGADTVPTLTSPYGFYTDVAVVFARSANWDADGDELLTPAESASDLALLGLRTAIGASTGWVNPAAATGSFSGTIDGYPARGTGLMEEEVFAQKSPWANVFDVNASLGPGASGGPLFRTEGGVTSVVGVLSSGDGALTTTTYASLAGANWQWVQDAIKADDAVLKGAQFPANGTAFPGAASGVVTYMGSASADTFRSTSLDETYLGRGALDTVTFNGARADYRMSHSAGDIVVLDTIAGRDGRDTFDGAGHVVFSDFSVNLQVGRDAQAISPWDLKVLESLYVSFFNRIPEADGLDFWINHVRAGKTTTQVADNFYSAALQYPNETGYTSAMTSTDFVNLVYRNTLGRSEGADPGGLAYWTNELAHGTSRGYLVNAIIQSAFSFKGDTTWGWVADLLDNKAYVANHFAVEMGLGWRTPQESIIHGMAVAAAVTPTSTAAAVALVGVTDTFSTLG